MGRLSRREERTKEEKLADQAMFLELRMQGMTYHEIAQETGKSYPMVYRDLDEVNRAAVSRVVNSRAVAIKELLNITLESIKESQAAWHQSIGEDITDIEFTGGQFGDSFQTIKKKNTGNPGHQRNVLKGVEIIAKLLKLYDEEKSDGAQLTAIEKALAKNHELAEKELAAQKKKYKQLKELNNNDA